ncbi:unnamed protein product [Ceratitis capitata]|uniref:(Mediterranean fruit fly) hypothetical protein n=1 Tax=Ceratitis capitata TaxID=7213 RepID=A0A811U3U9_CERCA|nr:unnamed protein product [Ceratitis capitata]
MCIIEQQMQSQQQHNNNKVKQQQAGVYLWGDTGSADVAQPAQIHGPNAPSGFRQTFTAICWWI